MDTKESECQSLINLSFDYYNLKSNICNINDNNKFIKKLKNFLKEARKCLKKSNYKVISEKQLKSNFDKLDNNEYISTIPKAEICTTYNTILDESTVSKFLLSILKVNDINGTSKSMKKRLGDKMTLSAKKDKFFFQ